MSTDILSFKEIYSNTVNKPTSNINFEKQFENTTLDWTKIYLLPRLATIDTTLRPFQYKILNNVLFLHKKLYNFGVKKLLFAHFVRILKKLSYISFMAAFMLNLFGKNYRRNFRMILSCHLFTPQTAILGLTNANIYNLPNHILLVFMYYVYRSREKHIVNIDIIIDNLIEIKEKEKANKPC